MRMIGARSRDCAACHGTGKFEDGLSCTVCYGTGYVWWQTGYEDEGGKC